jgi:hypothetical protein
LFLSLFFTIIIAHDIALRCSDPKLPISLVKPSMASISLNTVEFCSSSSVVFVVFFVEVESSEIPPRVCLRGAERVVLCKREGSSRLIESIFEEVSLFYWKNEKKLNINYHVT